MKIAFDAKRLYHNNTGLGHYSRTLVSSLAEYFPKNEYILCTPKMSTKYSIHHPSIQNMTPHHGAEKLFPSLWRIKWVSDMLEKQKTDIFHGLSNEIPFGIETKMKTVVTIHDLIFERFPQYFNPIDVLIYRKKFKYACKNAHSIIAVSQQTKADIQNIYGIHPNKIHTCYQSCNPLFEKEVDTTTKEYIKKKYSLPDRFFLYVGSITERKNLLLLCQALKIREDVNQIPLVVIGNGTSYKEKVKQFLKKNNMEQRVIFLSEDPIMSRYSGLLDSSDFPAIYQQALCMIYPSFFEGFGIPLLEAMWSKIPIICSNTSSLPEVVGDASLFINPLEKEDLADALLRITKEKSLREQCIQKGILYAQKFSRLECAKSVHKIYEYLHQNT